MIKAMTTRANELKGLLLGLVLATVWASTSLAEIVPVIHYTDSVPGASPLVKSAYFKFAIVDMGVSETRQGVTATATAIVSNGIVTSIVVNTFGSGYKTSPEVKVIGGGGSGAKATAILTNGMVSSIRVDTKGSKYTGKPVVIISKPGLITAQKYITYWSNDGTSVDGSEPSKSIPVSMNSGMFSVHLGDMTYGSAMKALTADLADKGPCKLKVWYSERPEGPFLALDPDQLLGGNLFAFYALRAGVADRLSANATIAGTQIALGSIGAKHLAPGLAGALPVWQEVKNTNLTASPNKAYIVPPGTRSNITLPGDAKVGEVVRVMGLGAKVSAPAGQTIEKWTLRKVAPTTQNSTGGISKAAVSDNAGVIYAQAESGIYRSMDSAKTWTSVWSARSASTYGQGLIGCSADGRVVLTRDEDAVGSPKWLLSSDFGTKWNALTMSQAVKDFLEMSKIKLSKNGLCLLAYEESTSGDFYFSKDQGKTWAKKGIPNLSGISYIEMSADGARLAGVGSHQTLNENALMLSSDGGDTWTKAALPLPPGNSPSTYQVGYLKMSTDGKRIVAYSDDLSESMIMWVSEDAGKTWRIEPPQAYFGIGSTSNDLSVQLRGIEQTYTSDAYLQGFSASYDFGLTWKDLSFKDARYVGDLNFSSSDSDAQYILISGDGTKFLILMPDSSPDMTGSYLITSWGDSLTAEDNALEFIYTGQGNWKTIQGQNRSN
jgi:hypothetical protein